MDWMVFVHLLVPDGKRKLSEPYPDMHCTRYEPPSEPTIRRFLQEVNAEAVDTAVYGWLQALSGKDPAIAVDGKTLKGARQQDGHKVHLLSAFLQQKGVVVAQCAVDRKTNEIPALRTLLDPLDIKDRVVTLDAFHTQKDTARYLVEEKKADYLFIVKKNQPTLKQDIECLGLISFPPLTTKRSTNITDVLKSAKSGQVQI